MSVLSRASQFRCAGVGSVKKSAESLTQRADALYQDSNAFINGLLVRGEAVEAGLKERFASRKASITSTLKGTTMIDQAFNSFFAKFGLVEDRRDKKLDELSSKVDNLVEVVAKLAAMRAAEKRQASKPATETAAKKPAARKTTTRKPAASKAAAEKPAASKAASKPASKPAAKATTTRKRATSAASKSTTTRKRSTSASKSAAKPADESNKD